MTLISSQKEDSEGTDNWGSNRTLAKVLDRCQEPGKDLHYARVDGNKLERALTLLPSGLLGETL